jgi:hypothetical protein
MARSSSSLATKAPARGGAYGVAHCSTEARTATSWACTEPRSSGSRPKTVRWGGAPGARRQATAGRSPRCARCAAWGRGRARALRRSSSPASLSLGATGADLGSLRRHGRCTPRHAHGSGSAASPDESPPQGRGARHGPLGKCSTDTPASMVCRSRCTAARIRQGLGLAIFDQSPGSPRGGSSAAPKLARRQKRCPLSRDTRGRSGPLRSPPAPGE